jgi:amino acid adenylation domain-containing protein
LKAAELHSRLRSLGIDVVADDGRLRVRAARGELTAELRDAIAEHRTELLALLDGQTATKTAQSVPELVKIPRGDTLPLSIFQERLWVLQRLSPGSTAYNLAVAWQGGNRYDAAHLVAAIRDVVERHEILRSTFIDENGVPRMKILDAAKVPIEIQRASATEEIEAKHLGNTAIETASHRPFDLGSEPPVRFTVWESLSGDTTILFAAHHIAVDAWSIDLLRHEIDAACLRLSGVTETRPAAPLQYADFAAWQRRAVDAQHVASQLAWWEDRMKASPALCVFPPDRVPGPSDVAGATFSFSWSVELSNQIRALARAAGATVYMVLVAACAVILRAHTGHDDIVLGSPMGTRERREFESIVGPFVNVLLLRLDLAGDPTFAELLRNARDAVLDAHAHRDVPLELLIERLRPARTFDHPPLFQVAVVLHNAAAAPVEPIHSGGSIHDLTLYVRDGSHGLEGGIEYRSDLYTRETIDRIGRHLEAVLAAVVADPSVRISGVNLLSATERRRIVETFNATAVDIDRATVPAQIERQVALSPDACALRFSGAELSYTELNSRANQLARQLETLGVGPGALVGVYLERSAELVVALLGIQKSGAAYLPLDPAFPTERLSFMLRDSGVVLVITANGATAALDLPDGVRSLDLATAAATLNGMNATDLPAAVALGDLAYVIYTSGSVGRPKGVRISHGALSNFLGSMRREPGLAAGDVLAAVTTVSFDIAALEIYLPLLVGARIELIARDVATDGGALAAQLDACGATLLQATPATLRLLVDAGWAGRPGLRVLCGGESLPPDLAIAVHGRVAELWNLYGPTETTIWSTVCRVWPGDPISIGRPIANTRVYVIGNGGQPVPIGMPGEIWIGGAGVAMGYHGRPELTAQRFVPDCFSSEPTARLYRTGDLGRWDADGRLYCLGRIDRQVKIRGFRIEPGEIEAVLRSHEVVRNAAVVARHPGNRFGDLRLVAYLVYRVGEELTTTEVRSYLRRRLPEVMIPSAIIALDSIPMTPNGKVDVNALPDPFGDAGRSAAYQPPKPGRETQIAQIWKRVLKVERVGADDNFFELGGHSLLALAVANATERETGWRMDPRSLFFQNLRQIVMAMKHD